MAAVVSVTLILISDLVTVFWVFTCIAFTLIDLLGLMYYWGLTVEISSSIIVIQATGLAIDYSAHIGHTFTTIRGSKSSTKSAFFVFLLPYDSSLYLLLYCEDEDDDYLLMLLLLGFVV